MIIHTENIYFQLFAFRLKGDHCTVARTVVPWVSIIVLKSVEVDSLEAMNLEFAQQLGQLSWVLEKPCSNGIDDVNVIRNVDLLLKYLLYLRKKYIHIFGVHLCITCIMCDMYNINDRYIIFIYVYNVYVYYSMYNIE